MAKKKAGGKSAPADVARFDVAIVSHHRTTNFGEGVASAFLRWLAIQKMVVPDEEAVADTWVEVYAKPGPSAHDLFRPGTWDRPEPVFHEAVLRWGSKPASLGYGAETGEVRFFFEIRGALFERPHGSVLARMKEVLRDRFESFARPHEALPPHREVPEDEMPKDRRPKRKERGPGLAGTRVEEL